MDSFADNLLIWYDRHARTLPWRISPADGKLGVLPDPYHVWLSEVMLQQTTVATVKAYFEKFVARWPSVMDLAAAETDDVMKEWAGLGYYSRARNLKACADIIAAEHGGRFPQTQAELLKLPGIGDYTSAAIAAIAFGERASVVDGNIERVATRQREIETPLPDAKKDCRAFMGEVTPADRPGDFVQAMMDLGATICTPRNPSCVLCPVRYGCGAAKSGRQVEFPVKAPKKAKPTRKGAAFVAMRDDGAVWLVKREDKGMLGGMAGVPTTDWAVSKDGATGTGAAPLSADWKPHGVVRHTFTHFHLELEVYAAQTEPDGSGWWVAQQDLHGEALPTLMKKAISSVLPDAFKARA
ncbi:A/G-specific adenine glycosylase [Pseudahrensia aquimaris]|uniref:Adenine DNA glycosylase n=1 Tax=Pseudahrensia aquimaris TaxID=744461 RepID=A0ABW3FHS3_9HYPH